MMSGSVVTELSMQSSSWICGGLTTSSLSGDEISIAAKSVVSSSICASNGVGLGNSLGKRCISKFSMDVLWQNR